jgi:hypothetical protein
VEDVEAKLRYEATIAGAIEHLRAGEFEPVVPLLEFGRQEARTVNRVLVRISRAGATLTTGRPSVEGELVLVTPYVAVPGALPGRDPDLVVLSVVLQEQARRDSQRFRFRLPAELPVARPSGKVHVSQGRLGKFARGTVSVSSNSPQPFFTSLHANTSSASTPLASWGINYHGTIGRGIDNVAINGVAYGTDSLATTTSFTVERTKWCRWIVWAKCSSTAAPGPAATGGGSNTPDLLSPSGIPTPETRR